MHRSVATAVVGASVTPLAEPWLEFIEHALQRTTDAHDLAARLAHALHGQSRGTRLRAIEVWLPILLGQRRAYGATLFLLGRISDPATLVLVARHLEPLPARVDDDEEAHLADLMRILAASRDPASIELVQRYLLEREIGAWWHTVPWALWPARRALFVAAWARRFSLSVAPASWVEADALEPFLAAPGAVRALRQTLEPAGGSAWVQLRDALAELAHAATWMSPAQRTRLWRALR